MGAHIVDDEFQSDKYPTTPRGKVPLSVKDPTAQDLLWLYAQRRRAVDAEFSADLEAALIAQGYQPSTSITVDKALVRDVVRVAIEHAAARAVDGALGEVYRQVGDLGHVLREARGAGIASPLCDAIADRVVALLTTFEDGGKPGSRQTEPRAQATQEGAATSSQGATAESAARSAGNVAEPQLGPTPDRVEHPPSSPYLPATNCTRCHEAIIDSVCACPVLERSPTDPVDAHPLLAPDQRAQMRARLDDTPGLTLLDLAKDDLRVAGISYPDLAQLEEWIEADVRHRQAAILYVYECAGALGVDEARGIRAFLVDLHRRVGSE